VDGDAIDDEVVVPELALEKLEVLQRLGQRGVDEGLGGGAQF
jgi:hypothetical protein